MSIKKPPRGWFSIIGACGRIRTSDRLVRSQVLYPAELRTRTKTDLTHLLTQSIGQLIMCNSFLLKGIRKNGACGRIRTSDRLVRSQVLYPAELRTRTKTFKLRHHQNIWRRGRDSNPRYELTYGSLAGNWFQPLTHLSRTWKRILLYPLDKSML